MFSKIKLDGESIMAMMGSTSDKMYLCHVPNFGFSNDKCKTSKILFWESSKILYWL
jgi:hypothetical protein